MLNPFLAGVGGMGAVALLAIVALGFVAIIFMWGMGIYNALIQLRNAVKNAFSQIDVQLQRRYDLIPNLIEVCKGYMKHESGTLEAVVAARSAAYSARSKVAGDPSDPAAMKALLSAEGALTSGLGRLMAIAESYPDLKANQNMMQLTEELTSTENKVSFSRQGYNDTVLQYNNKCEMFPSSIIANMFGHRPATMFEVTDPNARTAPKVSF